MKPSTKRQKEIVELSKRLHPISDKAEMYARKNAFDIFGFHTSKTVLCTECGQTFCYEDGKESQTCPHCSTRLKMLSSRMRKQVQKSYMQIINCIGKYQVFRIIYCERDSRKGRIAQYFFCEVMQHWVTVDGKETILAIKRNPMSYYVDAWKFGTDLEIRGKWTDMIIPSCTYFYGCIGETARKHGFRLRDNYSAELFKAIMKDSHCETLAKLGYSDMLHSYVYGHRGLMIREYWPTLRICFRNNYVPDDPSIYLDYLQMLEDEGKDLRNAKYVCPKYLMDEHNYYLARKERREHLERQKAEREREQRRALEIEEYKERYVKAHERFFGLVFVLGDIEIIPLKSIQDFIDEANYMEHCVFSNKYWKKDDSLILSARNRISGQRIETAEINLNNFTIVQCFGRKNSISVHHDTILDLIRRNIGKIKKVA